jgi:hypothetical protein
MRPIYRFLAIASTLALSACNDPIGDIVRAFDLTAINPPTTIPVPGTIIYAPSGSDYSDVYEACTNSDAYGASPPAQQDSTTETQDLQTKLTASLDVTGQYKDQLNATLGGSYVSNVSAHFANAHVFEISQAEVGTAVGRNQYTPGCITALKADIAAGRKLFVIDRVIQADASYSITYTASANATIQQQAQQTLQGTLQGNFTVDHSGNVTGTGLIWGVHADDVLFTIYANATGVIPGHPAALKVQPGTKRPNAIQASGNIKFHPAEER